MRAVTPLTLPAPVPTEPRLSSGDMLRLHRPCRDVLCLGLLGMLVVLSLPAAGIDGLASASPRPAQDPAEPPPTPTPEQATPAFEPPERPRFMTEVSARVQDIGSDVFMWGQSVTLAGRIGHNAFFGAQTGTVAGHVEGDVFAWAGGITVSGEIDGDLYVGTGGATILEGAIIHGNLICFCGSLNMDGTVGGTLLGSVGGANIGGTLYAIDIETGALTLTDTAVVHGDITYECNDEAEIADGAQIGGSVSWNREVESDEAVEEEEAEGGLSFWSIGWKIWAYLSNLIVGAVFLLLGGSAARAPAARLRSAPAPGLGFGFVVAVVFPVACLIAIALIVTLPLGIVGLMLFALGAFIARLVTAQFIGDWLLSRFGRAGSSEYLSLAAGLMLLFVAAEIPYVGFLIRLVAIILGIGGIYLALRAAGFPSVAASRLPAAMPGE